MIKKRKNRSKKVVVDKSRRGFRHEIGVSQNALASYLGISRSSLNQYERHRNSFLTPTQSLFDEIGKIVYGLDKYEQPASMEDFANREMEMLRKAMLERINLSNSLIQTLSIQLDKLRSEYVIASKGCKTACIMLEKMSKEDKDYSRKEEHLGLMGSASRTRMYKCGPAEQAELQLLIESLKFNAAFARRILEENGLA